MLDQVSVRIDYSLFAKTNQSECLVTKNTPTSEVRHYFDARWYVMLCQAFIL